MLSALAEEELGAPDWGVRVAAMQEDANSSKQAAWKLRITGSPFTIEGGFTKARMLQLRAAAANAQ
jgi:hypothetical protein